VKDPIVVKLAVGFRRKETGQHYLPAGTDYRNHPDLAGSFNEYGAIVVQPTFRFALLSGINDPAYLPNREAERLIETFEAPRPFKQSIPIGYSEGFYFFKENGEGYFWKGPSYGK
jgi:hypothetical protein